jgi:hypothetical protein
MENVSDLLIQLMKHGTITLYVAFVILFSIDYVKQLIVLLGCYSVETI